MPTKTWIEVPIDQEIEGVPESGYAPFFFPPDGANLLFNFTHDSFLRVLSAIINGAALTYPDTWLQVVWDFLVNVDYPIQVLPSDNDCIEYGPNAPFVSWYPHNPYTNPGWTGPGYAFGVWYVADGSNLIDATVGAVVTDVAHVRVGVGANAEFRVRVWGEGEVELHLSNVFAGGIGIIRVDGAIVDQADLQQDPTSVPAETENTTIWEFEFTTPGVHEIIVNMAPVVDDSLTPPVRYGGGLEKVVLCGLAIQGEEEELGEIRQDPENCLIIQQWIGGEWVTKIDLTACIPEGPVGETGEDGASAELRISGGYIQWRQSDDDPTWTNLIALADITGPAGETGAAGASVELRTTATHIQWRQSDDDPTWANLVSLASLTGPTGATGAPGEKGDKGDTGATGLKGDTGSSGGNKYEPPPIEGDAVCNAAAYIADRVRELIAGVYAQLSDEITPGEVMNTLLGQQGWNAGVLFDLITTGVSSLASEVAVLAAYDAAKSSMIHELRTHALSQDYILSWLDSHFASNPAVRDMTKYAVSSAAADGTYALWATVGAVTPSDDCEDLTTEECTEVIYNTATGNFYGMATGIYVLAGDVIAATVTGTYRPHPAYAYRGPDGTPSSANAQFLSASIDQTAFMMQVQGEGNRVWHFIGDSGGFTAPFGGELRVNVNEYWGGAAMTATGEYTNNDGSFTAEICITPAPVALVEDNHGAGSVVETSPNHYDILNSYTGHYATGSAISEDSVPFKVTSYSWVGAGDETGATVEIGGGAYAYNAIPDDVATITIGVLNAPAGKTLRIVIERA